MSGIQTKISRHAKKTHNTNKQENMIHKEKNQLLEVNSEMTKVLGLVSKDIKTPVTYKTLLKEIKETK